MKKLLFTALLAAASISPAFAAEKTVTFKDAAGVEAGTAKLTDTPSGLLVSLDIKNIAPGEKAFHIHETGVCDGATNFTSAGPHYNPDNDPHGYHSAEGPHDGDMPNVTVPESGALKIDVFNEEVKLAELVAGDGTALMIHASADDYTSQPAGNAGDRVYCAEIK